MQFEVLDSKRKKVTIVINMVNHKLTIKMAYYTKSPNKTITDRELDYIKKNNIGLILRKAQEYAKSARLH